MDFNKSNPVHAKIIELFNGGMSFDEVAAAVGRSRKTITNYTSEARCAGVYVRDCETPVYDRFYESGKRTPSGCLEWQLSTLNGYGQLWTKDDRHVAAHRWSWELSNGPIPDGLCVCHKCDNRLCYEPSHLFLGTYADNIHDMVAKGRNQRGETHSKATLSNEHVLYILQLYRSGVSQKRISQFFNTRPMNVSRIVRGERWKHLGEREWINAG